MNMKTTFPLLALASALGSSGWAATPVGNQQSINPDFLKPVGERRFAIEYVGKVPEIPKSTQLLRVWLPVPQNSTVQTISDLSFSLPPKLGIEPKYGNQVAYWELANLGTNAAVTMKFNCTRREIRADLDKLKTDGKDPANAFAVFKNADKLVLVDDEMKQLAATITRGKTTTVEKARAIYDHVLGAMTYDKNHNGWGLGSTRHACDMGKGNCTDFHALFNSLCRAQGIASGFEIGLYLPYEKGQQETLGGYHCWALFRVPGKTWVPVDCSEAGRFPQYLDAFFGGHTPNRVTLSTGRDLTLVPKPAGEPLNFFINPYAEADGKVVKTEKSWSFKDLN